MLWTRSQAVFCATEHFVRSERLWRFFSKSPSNRRWLTGRGSLKHTVGLPVEDRQQCLPFMPPRDLQFQQLSQPLGLHAAHRNLSAFFVVHPELVAGLEPRYDFADAIDVHKI